jgi:hypothetical protein
MVKKLIVILLVFLTVLFPIFWIVSVSAGGDAVNGKIENGRYYFCAHGKYTEVSRTAYVLSAGCVMALAAGVSIFLLLVSGLMMKGEITFKNFKEGGLLIFVPLLIGCGFLYLTILSLKCIIRAFGII